MFAYIDESGNTGINLLDPDQPFFISASILIETREKIDEAKSIYSDWENQFKKKNQKELKSKNLVQKNMIGLLELFTKFRDNTIYLSYSLTEKRFLHTCSLINIFFHPDWNDKFALTFNDKNKKLEVGNKLFHFLPDSFLIKVQDLKRTRDDSGFAQLTTDFVNLLSQSDILELSNCVDSIIYEKSKSFFFLGSREVDAPNVSNFLTTIMNIDRISTDHLSLVYDETFTYRKALTEAFDRYKEHRVKVFPLANEGEKSPELKPMTLNFSSSDNDVLVRAADMLAGAVNYIAKKIIREGRNSLTSIEVKVLKIVWNQHKGMGNKLVFLTTNSVYENDFCSL